MKNTIGSSHLDLLRTFAAWQVCIHHIKNLFFVDYQQIQSKNFFNQILYLDTDILVKDDLKFFYTFYHFNRRFYKLINIIITQ